MIESITLKGFQGHREFKLDLDAGVTTIVGPTDAGKSAILRAILWAGLNRAPKSTLIHEDMDKATVTLVLEDHTISRVKSTSKNLYKVDGKKLAAFGRDVPKEVTEVLRMSRLNFQGQHDPSLWFAESAAEVSRQLNGIVDLGIIDSTLSNLAGKLRKVKAEEEILTDQLSEAVQTKRKLRIAKKVHTALQAVEAVAQELANLQYQTQGLAQLLEDAREYRAEAKRQRARLAGGAIDLAPLERIAERIADKRGKITRIEALISQAVYYQVQTHDLGYDLKEAQASLKVEMGDRCPLCKQGIQS